MAEPIRLRMTEMDTPVGEMIALASDSHLYMFEFARRHMFEAQMERVRGFAGSEPVRGETPIFAQLRRELDEYFAGDRREFTVPLHVPGTPFQTKVWDALQRIPCGTTTSYARLAESIGAPKAVRAVARANGDNRVAILIPCHRVIGSDGSLVGYGGGLSRKKQLLQLEGRGLTLPLFAALNEARE
jgi:AraC family transcriptional regulator, regulatory protein of adaptative response / methylated-DNA-[protein]-cysteine methyltransferase